jgi:hypothetical protein
MHEQVPARQEHTTAVTLNVDRGVVPSPIIAFLLWRPLQRGGGIGNLTNNGGGSRSSFATSARAASSAGFQSSSNTKGICFWWFFF